MRNPLLLLLLILLTGKIGSAQDVDIELRSQPVRFVNPKIYVDSVVDNREFKQWIGSTKVGTSKKWQHLNLTDGVATAVKRHTDYILPPSPGKRAVTMHITVLSAKEQPSNGYESATVTVVASFWVRSGSGNMVEIFGTSSTQTQSGKDATTIYERLIRLALEDCLEQLNGRDIDKLVAGASAIGVLKKEERIARPLPDSVSLDQLMDIGSKRAEKVNPSSSNSAPLPMEKKEEPRESYYRVDEMSTISVLVGNNASGWTGTYYLNEIYSNNRITIPLTLAVEYMDNLTSSQSQRYLTTSIYYTKVGAELFYPLNRYFWLNAGLQIPLGNEKLSETYDTNVENLIIGISATQSIRVMSTQYEGLTVAVGLFEQLTTSKVQPFNAGVRVEIGMKF